MADPLRPAEARALIERVRPDIEACIAAGIGPDKDVPPDIFRNILALCDALEATLPRPIEEAPVIGWADDPVDALVWLKGANGPHRGIVGMHPNGRAFGRVATFHGFEAVAWAPLPEREKDRG